MNHGSYGACPRPVLAAQRALQDRLERQPLQLFRDLEGLLDQTRRALAPHLGADADDLAFVPNATTGVTCVVRALRLSPGDELLTTDHAYNACKNALALGAEQGARVVVAAVPFPLRSADEVVEAVLAKVTPRTRFALVDHVTSPTGLVFPVQRLVRELAARGVETMVDGAHAPGMVPVELDALGAAWWTGNCHKWLCTPKGSGVLWARRDRQAGLRPWYVGHGANSPRVDKSRFRLEFDLFATQDPSPWLAIPAALAFLEGLLPGGLPALRERNRALALAARDLLCGALGVAPPAPDEMIGALAAIPLPDGPPAPAEPPRARPWDPLQRALLEQHHIEVPVVPWPAPPRRLVRVSAQAYNSLDQYQALALALPDLLARERRAGAP